jgi:hypothetical protein
MTWTTTFRSDREDIMEYIIEDLSAAEPAAPAAEKSTVAIRQNITQVESALSEFDKVSAGLAAIAARYPVDLVYDVTTGAGMVEAVAHRAAWREPRLSVERLRKQAKAPVLALGKDIDARAAWLTEQLLIGEGPVDAQIKAEEKRKEDAKQARIAAEFGRVQAIQDAIAEIHMDATIASSKGSAVIAEALAELRSRTLDPKVFQELGAQAEAARTATVSKLEVAHKAALHTEAETARLAAEREELDRLRAEAAERKAKDEATARVEQQRVSADQEAERARIAAAQADIDKQRAEFVAQQEAARLAALPNETAADLFEKIGAIGGVAFIPVATPVPDHFPQIATPEGDRAPNTDEPATLNIGAINARIAPLKIDAAGLAQLGINPAATDKAAKLYTELQFARLRPLVECIERLRVTETAKGQTT